MPSTTTYRRGQVVVVNVTFTGQTGAKHRPALVVSTDAFHRKLPDLIVCPVSSHPRYFRRPGAGDHPLGHWRRVGLRHPSTVRISNILAMEKRSSGACWVRCTPTTWPGSSWGCAKPSACRKRRKRGEPDPFVREPWPRLSRAAPGLAAAKLSGLLEDLCKQAVKPRNDVFTAEGVVAGHLTDVGKGTVDGAAAPLRVDDPDEPHTRLEILTDLVEQVSRPVVR